MIGPSKRSIRSWQGLCRIEVLIRFREWNTAKGIICRKITHGLDLRSRETSRSVFWHRVIEAVASSSWQWIVHKKIQRRFSADEDLGIGTRSFFGQL